MLPNRVRKAEKLGARLRRVLRRNERQDSRREQRSGLRGISVDVGHSAGQSLQMRRLFDPSASGYNSGTLRAKEPNLQSKGRRVGLAQEERAATAPRPFHKRGDLLSKHVLSHRCKFWCTLLSRWDCLFNIGQHFLKKLVFDKTLSE